MKKEIISGFVIVVFLISLMYFMQPSKSEVDRYFEENKCSYCDGGAYGQVYQMRRGTGMLFGQIFNVPWWWMPPNFILYTTTPFNYYHEIAHSEDEASTFTWVDTRDGRFVYNAVTGEYVKEIDDKRDPAIKYLDEQTKQLEELRRSNEETPPENVRVCSSNYYDCADFRSQAHAQAVMEYCGSDDIHHLDGDDDGIACESAFIYTSSNNLAK